MTADKDNRLDSGTSASAIFLSHAHSDRAIADLLRNMLILAGVPEQRIFYSSGRSTGIPAGEDVRTYLQRTLQAAGLVMELITERFLQRPMCVMELGGAWVLGTPTYPIVVPPLSREKVRSEIGDVQMGMLGTDHDIDELFDDLHDRLALDVDIHTSITPWNRAVRDFKSQLPAKLKYQPSSSPVGPDAIPEPHPPILVSATGDGAAGRLTVEAVNASTGAVAFSNISITGGGPKRQLRGQVTNNLSTSRTLYIKATFYNAEGKLIGTKSSVISKLGPGDTSAFTIPGIPEHARREITLQPPYTPSDF